nr:PREDICTED: protein FAR1-RELATED SEQUENCE 5-like [Daucus carota subsp. sativus]
MTVAHQNFAFDCSKVRIGHARAFGLMKEFVGGYDQIGATVVEFKNWNRDLKNIIGNADAQVILNKFQSLKDSSNGRFYYEHDVDESGKLTKLFWADCVGRRNYDVFGDVISVDATLVLTSKKFLYNMVFVPICGVDNYRKCVTFGAGLLSKEDIAHYKWIFQALLNCMGRHPLCILTDQCAAMKQAIADVFDKEKTRHRLCMWHIMKKFPSKVGVVLAMDGGFLSKLKPFVWGENLDISEFEAGWKSLMDEFKMTDNEWLCDMYECRHLWIPAYFKEDPLLRILQTTSWSESANSFFSYYHQPGDTLSQFYLRFETAMDKQCNINSDLNHKSNVAFPSTDTELFLEKDAAELYTREIFYKFQKQVRDSCFYLVIKDMSGVEVKKFILHDLKAAKEFQMENEGDYQEELEAPTETVASNPRKRKPMESRSNQQQPGNEHHQLVLYILDNHKLECSCRMFERIGLPRSHLILALKQVPVHNLPRHLVLNGCMKNAEKNATRFVSSTSNDDKEKFSVIVNDIWFDFNSCMGLGGDNKEALDLIQSCLKDVKQKLRGWIFEGKLVVGNKKDVVEKFIGSEIPVNIQVQPPNQCRNKGCGTKRINSAAEKSTILSGKLKRICRYCKTEVYHDFRNCPIRKMQNLDENSAGKKKQKQSTDNSESGMGDNVEL